MPTFEYHAEDVGARLDSRTTDVLLLVIFAVLFFLLAFVSFLKADIN
jgi:hypothetical protein